VGYQGGVTKLKQQGLEHLRIRRWKVMKTYLRRPPSPDWLPLDWVQKFFHKKLEDPKADSP
jgi:hypothetical protein